MAAGDFAVSVCSRCFDLAPERFSALEVDSVKACRLTMRAADKWESARFLDMFLARGWFRFEGESTLRPLAANADR
jgi:hypothetical protein